MTFTYTIWYKEGEVRSGRAVHRMVLDSASRLG